MARRVWLLIAAVAALALVTGTGGFSAAQMDRGMTVNVAADGEAYVGLYDPGAAHPPTWATAYRDGSATSNGTVPLVAVRNQFAGTDLTVTVRSARPGRAPVGIDTRQATLGWGEQKVIMTDVNCTGQKKPVKLTVVATGEDRGLHAEISHTVWVPCQSPPTETPPAASGTPDDAGDPEETADSDGSDDPEKTADSNDPDDPAE
jgi:hypothetical protein